MAFASQISMSISTFYAEITILKFRRDILTCLGIVDSAVQVGDGVGGEYVLQ